MVFGCTHLKMGELESQSASLLGRAEGRHIPQTGITGRICMRSKLLWGCAHLAIPSPVTILKDNS